MKRIGALKAANALLAFQRGDATDDGFLGALLVVDHHADVRLIRMALTGKIDGE